MLLGCMIFCGFWFILLLYVQDGQTALYIASKEGRGQIVELLLRREANVNHPDEVRFLMFSVYISPLLHKNA